MAKYLILKNAQLESIVPLEEGEQIVEGWVTIGHEVRSFRPCLQKKEHWLQGDSPALSRIMVAYGEAMPHPRLYLPLFMILAGKTVMPPAEGFGTEYRGGISCHPTRSSHAGWNLQQGRPCDTFLRDYRGHGVPPLGTRKNKPSMNHPESEWGLWRAWWNTSPDLRSLHSRYGTVQFQSQTDRFNMAVPVRIAWTHRL